MIDYKALAEPFEFEDLEFRIQKTRKKANGDIDAMIVPYVTARAIQDRLDKVCEPIFWWNEFREWKGGQLCGITVMDGDRMVTKWDGAPDTNIEKLKGGLSDSMKRAAVQWGIGRYLYYLPKMKARILKGYAENANYGEYKSNKDPKPEPFWWTPNAAAVKAIKEASK